MSEQQCLKCRQESNKGRLLAKARDKFFRKNPDLFETASLYRAEAMIYLKNRLEKAFIAGWDARKK